MRTVGDVATKVLTHNNVPGGPKLFIKIALDVRGDVFLDVEFFESGRRDVDGCLLHLLGHVDVFDRGLGAGGRDGLFLVGRVLLFRHG